MDKTEKAITFDNLPQAVALLLSEVRELRSLIETNTTYGGFSPPRAAFRLRPMGGPMGTALFLQPVTRGNPSQTVH